MRFFIAFAIASIILLIFYPSTNAKPFLDNKFDQKFDNKHVWNNIKQQMEGNGQQHVVVHKRSIDDNLMSATEKMIDSQGAYVTDKLGEDRTENGTKSKRHVKLDGGKIYYGRSEVLINNRIIKVTQQQIGNGQQIIVINKVKRGTKRI